MIYLRRANDGDLPIIMAWRNQEKVYEGFYTQTNPLTWEEHTSWWESRNRDWRTFIIELVEQDTSRPIGIVNIGQLDHWSPEIGYTIGEIGLWGKGYGKEAVRLGLEWVKTYGKEYAHTTIKNDNKRSIRLIKSLGFRKLGKAREGETWYQKKL